MDNAIYEYIKNGITIDGNPIDGYKVFTIPTQWFHIDSLHQLTPQVFEEMIEEQKEKEWFHSRLLETLELGVQKEIDENIINQLRGGEPNPDIIPIDTTDRLFFTFLDAPDPDADPDLIWNKWQFIDKLLFDDEFYQKWGKNCCEEFTDEERYNIWFNNNYETGMERYFDPNNLPDYDNDYYEPTPKRKIKEMELSVMERYVAFICSELPKTRRVLLNPPPPMENGEYGYKRISKIGPHVYMMVDIEIVETYTRSAKLCVKFEDYQMNDIFYMSRHKGPDKLLEEIDKKIDKIVNRTLIDDGRQEWVREQYKIKSNDFPIFKFKTEE